MSAARFSTFGHKFDTSPVHVECTLQNLAENSPHTERPSKDGPLFSPAEYRSGAARGNAGVLRVHFFVVDIDHVTHDQAASVLERLEGLERWVYSTHSYSEEDAHGASIRAVLGLSRPVEASEWSSFWAQVVLEFAPETDAARKDLAGMYYLPACRPGAPRLNAYMPGAPLDVGAILERAQGARGRTITTGDELPDTRRLVIPTIDDNMREWATNRLHELARAVERMPCPGPIYPTLNHAAFTAGRFVPHVLTHEAVHSALHGAHARRNPDAVVKNDLILLRGMEDGKAMPWRPARPYELTDAGLSQRLLDEHGEHLRYVGVWGKWLGFDGAVWRTAGDAAPAFLAVRDLAASMRDEAEYVGGKRGTALRAAARRYSSAGGAAALIRMASPLPKFRIAVEELDPAGMLFACANGVVDLSNGNLHEHLASHYMTASTRVAYDPRASAPTWERFVREVCCDDVALVRYLQRAVGYTLTGYVHEQCLFFLYGDGANGKSTFINILQRVLGEYSTVVGADLVLSKRHEQHPTAIASLHGRRMAAVLEVDDGRPWDEATVKNLTGSDTVTARRMREDFWTFTPKHKLWIAGNYRPTVRGVDNGIWRRMRLVPFNASFVGREDTKLTERLLCELPGILAWAVQGASAWSREGLVTPPSVLEETKAYREEQDFFSAFVAESLEVTRADEFRVARSQVAQLYEQWRTRNGASQLSARGIAERLRRHGVGESNVMGVRYWTGLKIRSLHAITTAN